MILIAKRACVIGAIGVMVSITLHQDARGAIPARGWKSVFPGTRKVASTTLPLYFDGDPCFAPDIGVLKK